MALRKSSRAVRIRGLQPTTTRDEFGEIAIRLNEVAQPARRNLFSSALASVSDQPHCSLALQNGSATGTISFASTEMKGRVMKRATESVHEWTLDDHFDGLIVLRLTDEEDIE